MYRLISRVTRTDFGSPVFLAPYDGLQLGCFGVRNSPDAREIQAVPLGFLSISFFIVAFFSLDRRSESHPHTKTQNRRTQQ